MNSQSQQILEHMKKYGSITPMDALNHYGCMRLGARIYDLKAAGVDICSEIERYTNADGQKKKYAKYWIRESA